MTDRLREEIGALRRQVNNIKTGLLRADVAAAQADIDALSADVAAAQADIDALKGYHAAGYVLGEILYFTSSGTFVKANYPGLRAVKVKVQGGGGAGGGRREGTNSVGAGGGGGGYGEKFILAENLASSESITVGLGGTGRAANSGTGGSPSRFGNHITANGGGGGDWTLTDNTTAQGGSGGTVTGADFSVPGQDGQQGRIYQEDNNRIFFPGSGGSSFLGLGALSAAPNQTGFARPGTGWGSGGAGIAGNSGNNPGGNGRPGIVIVELYY